MLIEQTNEFQLKGPGPFGRTCTPITGKLHDETKTSKKNLREDYCLLLKYCRWQCALLPPTDQITYNYKFTPQCKILNVFWDLMQKED